MLIKTRKWNVKQRREEEKYEKTSSSDYGLPIGCFHDGTNAWK
jgi:hypothetical protein